MKYISLFAGIGGFDLALERLGHECVYSNDFDKYCKIVYDKHFNIKLDIRSIKDIQTKELPKHDLLVGGFPCQSFSVAGRKLGFKDTRGTLFFDIARILRDKKPRYFILENVKGLLSHDSGKTFSTILRVLTDLGYEYQWQILNSKNFGVPQNRERVFIVGYLRGEPRPEIFPIGESDNLFKKEPERKTQTTPTLRAGYKQGMGGAGYIAELVPLKFLNRNQRNISGDYSFTIDRVNTGGVKIGERIRRFTPLECERLQGFPDNWTGGVSDSQRYKMLGNAVTVNVVYEVAKRLGKYEQKNNRS